MKEGLVEQLHGRDCSIFSSNKLNMATGTGVTIDDGHLQWMLKNLSEASQWLKATEKTKHQKVIYNVHALLTDLKSCSIRKDLQWGRRIHVKAVESRHDSNLYVVTALIRMYGKCRSMAEARRVFDSIQKPDVVCWNVLLVGYTENENGLASLESFSRMKPCGCVPSSVTYIAALQACTFLAGKRVGGGVGEWLTRGKEIHSQIDCELNIFLKNTLIDMYANCGSMVDAHLIFDSIAEPDVVSWNALLLGYAENGDGLVTLDLFSKMKACGCRPSSVTYIAAIKACTSVAGVGQGEWLELGRKVHSEIECDLGIVVQSTLIDMYRKCGSMVDARYVFDNIQKPDVVSWSTLLLGYAENGDGIATLELFSKMKACGCAPNSMTYVAALKACTILLGKRDSSGHNELLKLGREIHSQIGCNLNIFVQNTLINMYRKCGSLVDARRVFDIIRKPDVVSWNALLLGYVENGEGFATLELFLRMKLRGCAPDSVTHIAVLKACGLTGALALGRKLHLEEINEFTVHVVTCLVDFYAKCGSIVEARSVFDEHSSARSISTWTALLTGYGSFGDVVSVFNLFEAMQDQGFQPDAVTLVCILSCCSHAGLVEKARGYFEAMSVQYGLIPTVMHYNCMVDILGRANQLNEAVDVLQKMPCNPNVVTWITLLGACHKWKNVEIGMHAFQSLVDMDKKNAAAYVLMAHIYSSRGLWEEEERVLKARTKLSAWKLPGPAYVYDEVGNMVKFVVGQEDPPDVKNKLEQLLEGLKEHGCSSAEYGKEEALCDHTERRAVVYSILRIPPSEPVRAFKDTRMCANCHEFIKMISVFCGRIIMIRYASRFHVVVNGTCSCGDYW